MKSLPPHYVAVRIALTVLLGALAVLAAFWFVGVFPDLVRGLGG